MILGLWAAPLLADDIRVATYAAPLSRDGPGLLLRDLGREDDQIAAIKSVIATVAPDVLLLTDFDFDHDNLALSVFAEQTGYPYHYSARPNAGLASGVDLDRNGRLGEARDAQGYGRFSGDGGLAVLSQFPIQTEAVIDFSSMLWRDLDGARLPDLPDGAPWPDDLQQVQRLSTTAHWVVPIDSPVGPLQLLAFGATPPVFDGPEDRNGLRNRDELRLWQLYLDGAFGPPAQDFVIAGNANLDPADGAGLTEAMATFLRDPRLQDPQQSSAGALAGADPDHRGDPAQDTADWPSDGPGNLRVSYVLPAATWKVTDAGVFWPAPDETDFAILGADGSAAGAHHLVWADLSRD